VLGPPRVYWGEERYPVRFEAAEAAPAFVRRLGFSVPDMRNVGDSAVGPDGRALAGPLHEQEGVLDKRPP
jgi:hypothetical protein